jgi:hypothetical protein
MKVLSPHFCSSHKVLLMLWQSELMCCQIRMVLPHVQNCGMPSLTCLPQILDTVKNYRFSSECLSRFWPDSGSVLFLLVRPLQWWMFSAPFSSLKMGMVTYGVVIHYNLLSFLNFSFELVLSTSLSFSQHAQNQLIVCQFRWYTFKVEPSHLFPSFDGPCFTPW